MATILDQITSALVASATKIVSSNDIQKKAYVATVEQREVLARAGFHPVASSSSRLITIVVAGTNEVLPTSYYDAYLGVADRKKEPRMGRGVVNWLGVGDELLLGTDGKTIFARKVTASDRVEQPPEQVELVVEKVFSKLDGKRLLERAENAPNKPPKVMTPAPQYARDPAIREFVLRRCKGVCEVCGWVGFKKIDGSFFMEVHHIVPLAKGGDDTIWNAVGVCPNCHRLAHHGADLTSFVGLAAKVKATTDAYKLTI